MNTIGGRELFLAATRNESTPRPPAWMMRQAGRHLPEYREIRQECTFREAISTPEVAAEISLQPWERYRPDGVVMYSDILTALEPLGFEYHIESGVGPVIENPIEQPEDVDRSIAPVDRTVDYVGDLLTILAGELGDDAAVIGFIGGPFTLAAYATQGTPTRSFMALRRFRYDHPESFRVLLERLGDVLSHFVDYQVRHGADVIQLFDTYAGLLSTSDYRELLLPVHQRVAQAAEVPTIAFARNMGGRLSLLQDSGADVMGLDWTISMEAAIRELNGAPVQGNLDPAALYGSRMAVRRRTRELIDAGPSTGHIVNLGHGVHKQTPPENVAAFFEEVRATES